MWRRIESELREIRHRLEQIEKLLHQKTQLNIDMKNNKLLELDDHHRISYITVAHAGEATATEVSIITGRCRARESGVLNDLVRLGYLKKIHRGRETVFFQEPTSS